MEAQTEDILKQKILEVLADGLVSKALAPQDVLTASELQETEKLALLLAPDVTPDPILKHFVLSLCQTIEAIVPTMGIRVNPLLKKAAKHMSLYANGQINEKEMSEFFKKHGSMPDDITVCAMHVAHIAVVMHEHVLEDIALKELEYYCENDGQEYLNHVKSEAMKTTLNLLSNAFSEYVH